MYLEPLVKDMTKEERVLRIRINKEIDRGNGVSMSMPKKQKALSENEIGKLNLARSQMITAKDVRVLQEYSHYA